MAVCQGILYLNKDIAFSMARDISTHIRYLYFQSVKTEMMSDASMYLAVCHTCVSSFNTY